METKKDMLLKESREIKKKEGGAKRRKEEEMLCKLTRDTRRETSDTRRLLSSHKIDSCV